MILKDITHKKLEIADNESQMSFELNDFIYQEKLIMFNLKIHLDLTKYDSLFIYTNINKPRTFVLCKDFRTIATNEYKCTDAKDLFKEYGRSIPPLFSNRQSTLKTLNIEGIKELINTEEFTYLIVNIPVHKKEDRHHQMIVKFDWYLKSNRVKDFELPSFKTNLQGISIKENEEDAVFQRYYLPTFKNVLQAYQLNKVETSCDKFLTEQSLNTKIEEKKPLSLSNVSFINLIVNSLGTEHGK